MPLISGMPLISNGFPLHPLRKLRHRRELVRRLGPRPQSVRRRRRLGEQFRGATSEPLPLRQDIPGQLQRLRVPSEPRVEDAPAGLACPARDHQLLPGPGAGHIEDALLLGFQESGFLALVLGPVQRLGEGTRIVRPGGDGNGCEGFRFAPRSAPRMRIRTARSRNALPGVGQDHDGRLQPLRLVQVHDPHGVIVPRVERGFGIFPVQRRFQGVYGSGQRSISPQRLRSHGVQRVGQNAGPQRSQLASGHVGHEPEAVDQPADEDIGRLAPTLLPPVVQGGERSAHLGVGPVFSRRVVFGGISAKGGSAGCAGPRTPACARVGEIESSSGQRVRCQLLVIEAEEESRQHRNHIDRVARVDQGPEQEDEFAQFLLRARLRPRDLDGHVALLQRPGIEIEMGLLAGEHQKIARPALSLLDARANPAGEDVRLQARRIPRSPGLGHGVAEHALGPAGLARMRDHGRETGLSVRFLPRKAVRMVEHLVHHVGERLARAEVGGEQENRAERLETGAHLVVDDDVGAPEAVDALLGVAHHEEGSRPGDDGAPVGGPPSVGLRGEQEEELRLDRVGVLKLVDQHVPIALPQIPPHVGVLAEQPGRQHEEVVEAEHPDPQALLGELHGRPADESDREAVPMREPAVEMTAHRAILGAQGPEIAPQRSYLRVALAGWLGPAVERQALDRTHPLRRVE